MKNSSKLIGWILIAAGVLLGIAIVAWLNAGESEGNLDRSGQILGLIVLIGAIVIPLVGVGVYLLRKGQQEAKQMAKLEQQRRLMDSVSTEGTVQIANLALEMGISRDEIESDLRRLVGLGLFTGYVDWQKGTLFSVEASKLNGRSTCPNCGGQLTIAGKGVIKCPYCGVEIFT